MTQRQLEKLYAEIAMVQKQLAGALTQLSELRVVVDKMALSIVELQRGKPVKS